MRALNDMLGKKVKAIAVTDMHSDNDHWVEGTLIHSNTSSECTKLYFIETEEGRHVRFDADSIQLIPEKSMAVLEYDDKERMVLRTLITSAIPPWERDKVFEWVVFILGLDAALSFLGSLRLVNVSEEQPEPPAETSPETAPQCPEGGCTMPQGHSGRHGVSLASMANTSSAKMADFQNRALDAGHDAPCLEMVTHGIAEVADTHRCRLPAGHLGDHI